MSAPDGRGEAVSAVAQLWGRGVCLNTPGTHTHARTRVHLTNSPQGHCEQKPGEAKHSYVCDTASQGGMFYGNLCFVVFYRMLHPPVVPKKYLSPVWYGALLRQAVLGDMSLGTTQLPRAAPSMVVVSTPAFCSNRVCYHHSYKENMAATNINTSTPFST